MTKFLFDLNVCNRFNNILDGKIMRKNNSLHMHFMHLSMLSCWGGGGGGRPGIGGGFDSSYRPVLGTFDRFNGFSSNILVTFSCSFGNPQMPWGVAFEQKLSAQLKCPAYARPPLPPPPLPAPAA